MEPRFTFVTSYETDYSRSGVLLSFLSKKGLVSEVIKFDSWRLLLPFAFNIFKANKHTDYYVIMNPSQFLTPIVRFLTSKRIILDSGWPLTEKSKTKNASITLKIQRIKSWIIDFISMHLANLVLLESEMQKNRTSKRFKVAKYKISVSLTGTDEESFANISKYSGSPDSYFKVGFRGKYTLEAGLEVLAEATHLCIDPNITFLVLASNIPPHVIFASNTLIENKPYSDKREMAEMLMTCDVLLGQLSDHPRLNVTIPHKAFEAAAMGKPYLTARATGIQEFLVEGLEAEYFKPGDAADLLLHIQKLKRENEYREMLSVNIKQKYGRVASEKAIGEKFLAVIDLKFL
jgi:hypothetical protein